jgi:hypothetical protein
MIRTRMLSILIGCLAGTNLAGYASVNAREPRRDESTAIAPFLDDQTVAVASVDLDSLSNVAGLQAFLETTPDNHEFAMGLLKTLAILSPHSFHVPDAEGKPPEKSREAIDPLPVDGVRLVYVVAMWSDVMQFFTGAQARQKADRPLFLVVPGVSKPTIEKLRALLPEPGKTAPAEAVACREIDSCAVIAETWLLDRLATLKAAPRPEIEAALAAAGDCPVRIAVAPSPLFAQAATEILQTPALGADRPLGEYLASVRWIAVGIDPAADSRRLAVRLALTPAGDRDRMLDFIRRLAIPIDQQLAKDSKLQFPSEPPPPELPPAKVEGDQILWTLDEPFRWLLARLPDQKNLATPRDSAHLRQIGLALQNDHDVHKQFPDVAIRDRDGKPLLSWRVAILPYLDGGDELYKQFHLNEAWDSEHNRKLIDKMPYEFRSSGAGAGRTRFLAPVGENVAFKPEKGGLSMKTFTDGTSATILVVEADVDHAVVWTKPEDLVVDLENPKRGITDGEADFLTVFVDSAPHRFKGSIRPNILRAMFTRNGGEIYNIDNIYPAP